MCSIFASMLRAILARCTAKTFYRVRISWADTKSQIGAYTSLDNAKAACDKAGAAYSVFDANGLVVYPEKNVVKPEGGSISAPAKPALSIGDEVKLLPGAVYTSGKSIPAWVFKAKLYLREVRKNTGNYVVSTQKTGAVTGVVEPKYVVAYDTVITEGTNTSKPAFTSYLVAITADVLNVRQTASTKAKVTTQVKKDQVYTIVAEDGRWGKLKSGVGWIHLDYTKKI